MRSNQQKYRRVYSAAIHVPFPPNYAHGFHTENATDICSVLERRATATFWPTNICPSSASGSASNKIAGSITSLFQFTTPSKFYISA